MTASVPAKPSGIKAYVSNLANRNRLIATSVYHLAYYAQWVLSLATSLHATLCKVAADRVKPLRGLEFGDTMKTSVTNICNAKCVFCAYPQAASNGKMKMGVMSFDVFKKSVDEWASFHGENLDLTPTVGDTLVDPGLLRKIHYAVHEARIPHVVLTTNGILLNKHDMFRSLIDSGIRAIYISTQGTDREIYKQVYRVDCYEEVMTGIRHLLDYNQSKGNPVYVGIRFRNAQTPAEILSSEDFQYCIQPYLCDSVECNFTVDYDNWGGSITKKDVPRTMRLRKLPIKTHIPCVGLFNYMVLHDGKVRMCGCRLKDTENDDMVVGDIKDHTVNEISQGDRAWSIIEGFYSGKRPEACDACTFYRPIDRRWLAERIKKQNAI